MSYGLYNDNCEHALNAAMAVEVFHNFTLMHDDVMDAADLRRGLPATHIKYDLNTAILSGDAMLIHAFGLLAGYRESESLVRCFTKMAVGLCEGQRLDMDFEKVDSVPILEYLEMITGKTAILLAASLQMGAILGGATELDQTHLYEFGKNIGIAFQMLDDILDYTQTPENLSKPVLNDVRQGIYTLPLILGVEKDEAFLPLLKKGEHLSDSDLTALLSLLQKNDCIEHAYDIAKKYIDEALASIDALPSHPEKDVLYSLTKSLLKREF